MKKVKSFGEVLEAADKLSLDEQEAILDILRRRMIEQRRKELAVEIRETQREFKAGLCRETTPDEIVKEILS